MRKLPPPLQSALTLVLLWIVPLSHAMPRHPPRQPVWQKGITYTHLYRHNNNLLSQRSNDSLRYLRHRIRAEWISLTPFAYQRTDESPHIYTGRDDPPDEHLRHAIREAHRLGLKVMLKPHIWLQERRDGHWRGSIAMAGEQQWHEWFASYERFILHYARLAAAENVELFCVGTELSTTAHQREADWRRVIEKVRAQYPGPLVYAANWWKGYELIPFWDALDYIGINAFFPLSDAPDPSLASLRRHAGAIALQLEALHRRTGKPVIFTEVGFKSVRGASLKPWEWTRSHDVVDLAEQAHCYQAVFETFWNKPWFYGMYWWKWFSDLELGGARHTGFTPQHKPAEAVLSQWYHKPLPQGAGSAYP